jgi:uncharacterized protein with GYD domain
MAFLKTPPVFLKLLHIHTLSAVLQAADNGARKINPWQGKRFYSCSSNDRGDEHMISACILIRTERGRFDEVVDRMKQFKETKNVMAVLGRYDVVVDIEIADYETLGSTVMKMGKIGGVVFTETLPEMKIRG